MANACVTWGLFFSKLIYMVKGYFLVCTLERDGIYMGEGADEIQNSNI